MRREMTPDTLVFQARSREPLHRGGSAHVVERIGQGAITLSEQMKQAAVAVMRRYVLGVGYGGRFLEDSFAISAERQAVDRAKMFPVSFREVHAPDCRARD